MFLEKDFLLTNDYGKKLFHEYAKKQPICDYHCHLVAKDIYENKQFEDLTQIWLYDNGAGDHYKWRLLRSDGVEEKYITGSGSSYEKYLSFVQTLKKAIGNPIFEWSHLELRRYFGIEERITEENAATIWEKANKLLAMNDFTPKRLVQKMNVKALCTTDDPLDDLKYHCLLKKEEVENGFSVLPTFRPDMVLDIEGTTFREYMAKFSESVGFKIVDFDKLEEALEKRVQYFHEVGGRLSDHGLNTFHYLSSTRKEANEIVQKALAGAILTHEEVIKYQSAIQLSLMAIYERYGWTMQLHMNALRNDSTKSLREIGINAGFDSMGDQSSLTSEVVQCFSQAEEIGAIPRTILYSLNPQDFLPLATAMQAFQGGMEQRIQLGSGWWFNDTRDGMIYQLTTMAQQSLLGNFIGMLTDSRSFLSYPRHEYFRRILCNLIGEWVENGQIPAEEDFVGKIIEDICYENARKQLNF